MKKINYIIVIILLIFTSTMYGQKEGNEKPSFEQLKKEFIQLKNQLPELKVDKMPKIENGRLSFTDEDHFNYVYNQLSDILVRENNLGEKSIYYIDPDKLSTLDPNGVLLSFENNFNNYNSQRALLAMNESHELYLGTTPEKLSINGFTDDEIINSFFNENYEVKIGKSIIFPYDNVLFKAKDEVSVQKIKEGRPDKGIKTTVNPYDFNVEIFREKRIIKDDPPCEAIASFESNGSNMSYSFLFTGSPNPNNTTSTMYFYWQFGDGTTSNDRNPSHSYENPGTYNVCLYIEVYDPETGQFCNDTYCSEIEAKEPQGDCEWFEILKATFVYTETGTPGELCFTGTGNLFAQIYDQDLVVNWFWNFGDNTTSDEMFPCHIFPCDKEYIVTLVATTEDGCVQQWSWPVQINSYKCCNDNAGVKGTENYANNLKIKWKQYAKPVWPYIITKKSKILIQEKHYKKSWGIWWRKKANLMVKLEGSVFGQTATGCTCEDEHDITTSKSCNNSSICKYERTRQGRMHTKRLVEWSGKYYVGGDKKVEEVSEVFCD